MSTENNPDKIYKNSIRILTDLIAFKTISGNDNNSLINYCDEILKNLGRDSIISLYGSNESSWEASVYIIDIAKQNDIKISLNGNRK